MKVQLERKLGSCPSRILCIICRQGFEALRIRALLYSDSGLIQGDVCPDCLKLKASGIKQKLRESELSLQAELEGSRVASQQALLPECSAEAVRLPRFYEWWLKQVEIFSQESQELEAARLGLSSCHCGRRSRLRIVFEDDRKPD